MTRVRRTMLLPLLLLLSPILGGVRLGQGKIATRCLKNSERMIGGTAKIDLSQQHPIAIAIGNVQENGARHHLVPLVPLERSHSCLKPIHHLTRWLSEDLSAIDQDENVGQNGYGRRPGHRSGSSDSPITLNMSGGRSVVGESLRAAGLTKRNDDVFASSSNAAAQSVVPRRTRSTGSGSIANGEVQTNGRVAEGVGPPRTVEFRTPANRHERSVTYSSRPGTSMAALHSDEPRTAPAGLRTYRSTYTLERETSQSSHSSAYTDGHSSAQSSADQDRHDRRYSSPYPNGSTRAASTLPTSALTGNAARDPHLEHRRLMLEALTMFESHLSRLPPMGQTTTTTIPEVFQTSQHLVHTTDKLNTFLKTATNQALEAQIDAEVADHNNEDAADIWNKVGMEYRDCLRLSDEVVRTMTAFLLGVGKVLREATTSASAHQHMRTMSLDEDAVNRQRATPELGNSNALSADRRSSDGRRSRETRRSWDPRDSGQLTSLTRMTSRERTSCCSSHAAYNS
ncbi:hypothetical protein K474DRAFT_111328 [Panus rudis PR-1116 ss-1]|nr:hypothetical protein K474DRAFT_111328 [Panus rudis PR-1116 ss-1]